MRAEIRLGWVVLLIGSTLAAGPARGQGHHGGHPGHPPAAMGGGNASPVVPVYSPFFFGGGFGSSGGFGYGGGFAYGGGFGYSPQPIGLGPWSYLPPTPSPIIGLETFLQPRNYAIRVTAPRGPAPAPRAPDVDRSAHYLSVGDRFFRAGDTRRAADRYAMAAESNPDSALPRLRLAQLDVQKGKYAEAAFRLREAVLAEPGMVNNAPDLRGLYSEPADLTRVISKLETHLQGSPGDRDAWLILGAQFSMSGQPRKAEDVFLRLSDRPDPVLEMLLDATRRPPVPRPRAPAGDAANPPSAPS